MATNEMVWKYCNIQNREAAFMTLPGNEADNIRLVGRHYVECLDVDSNCSPLGCKFAQGNIDPFVAA
jgi:hypothetical protein